MKVALYNRNHKDWIGGDAIQLEETLKQLIKLGVDAEYCYGDIDVRKYDLIHVFSINFKWTEDVYRQCIEMNKPFIISAIFYPEEHYASFKTMERIMSHARKVIALSYPEVEEMTKLCNLDLNKSIVVPNGVDSDLFKPRVSSHYALVVGRLTDRNKGIGIAVGSCKALGYPIVYIGDDSDTQESKLVHDYATCYHGISQEEVAEIYSHARIYICPSLSERQSLSVIQAASCKVPIVDSKFNRGNSLIRNTIISDPLNIQQFMGDIKKQWEEQKEPSRPPTWKDVALKIKSIYESVHIDC